MNTVITSVTNLLVINTSVMNDLTFGLIYSSTINAEDPEESVMRPAIHIGPWLKFEHKLDHLY